MLTVNYGIMFREGHYEEGCFERTAEDRAIVLYRKDHEPSGSKVIKRQPKRRCETRIPERR
jgi:hypothetical protein